jgi:hypothetical protein
LQAKLEAEIKAIRQLSNPAKEILLEVLRTAKIPAGQYVPHEEATAEATFRP